MRASRLLFAALFLFSVLLGASSHVAFAAVTNSPTAATLQAQILALTAQLQSLSKAKVTTTSNNSANTASCSVAIARLLTVGSRGTDVTKLQQTLVSLGYLKTTPTGYFGVQTRIALQKFQSAKKLSPVGFTGPGTRAALANLICATNTQTSTTIATSTPKIAIPSSGGRDSSNPVRTSGGSGVAGSSSIVTNYTPQPPSGLGTGSGATGTGIAGSSTVTPTPTDTTAPEITVTAPLSTLTYNTTSTTLSVTTDESSTCVYSTVSGTAFASATTFTSTGGLTHSTTISSLTNGSSYTYYVQCRDSVNNVGTASVAFAVSVPPVIPVDITAPSAPSTLIASVNSATAITLSWIASTDNVGVSSYQIFRNGGAVAIGQTTSPSYQDTGLTGSTAYSYVVKAIDAAGNVSNASNQVNVTTSAPPDTTPPSVTVTAPLSNLASGITSTTLSVTTNEAASCAYSTNSALSFGSMTVFTVTGNLTHTVTLAPLTDGGSYAYYVKCRDAALNISGNASVIFSVAAPVVIVPTWTNTAFASQSSAFTASFDATPSQNNADIVIGLSASPATAYTDLAAIVRFNTSGTIDVRDGAGYAYGVSVPYSAGVRYTFREVVNLPAHLYSVYVTPQGQSEILLASNYSFRTEQASVSTLANYAKIGDPGDVAITNFNVVAAAPTVMLTASPTTITSGGSSTLTWSSTNATTCTASGGWSGAKAVNGTSLVNPTTSTTYTLSCSGVGGSFSQSVTVTVNAATDTTAPSIPTGVSATTISSSAINLSWSASTDAVGVTGYKIYRNGTQIATAATTAYSDTGLTASTAYSYTIAAYDAAGNTSQQSTSVSATTQAPVVVTSSSTFPDSTNTGYKNAPGYPGSLTTFTGTIQSNQTYRFYNFPAGVTIPAGVNNVSFFGCRFASNTWNNLVIYGNNIAIDYSTFEPSVVSAPPVSNTQGYQYAILQQAGTGVTVDHSDIWGYANGIQILTSNQAAPFVIKNSWFHDARADGGTDHTDAILENWGGQSYITIDHNTIVSSGNTNGIALQGTTYNNITITNNYLSGFGYTLNIGGSGTGLTNSTITGNVYGNDIQPVWGPLYGWTSGNGNTWKCNVAKVVGSGWQKSTAGAYSAGWMPVASDNGKYWIPTAAYNSPVSSTDYLGNTSCATTPPPTDTTAPSIPTGVSATTISSSAINLSWSASTDAVGVTGYKIYRNGTQIATAATTAYSDTGLTASTAYSYTIAAYDAAGNTSQQSTSVSATTQAPVVVDTTAPTVSISSPSGQLASGTTQVTLSVTTNEAATCSWSNTAGVAFGSMSTFSSTGGTTHTTMLSALSNGSSYTTYVKCRDVVGNTTPDISTVYSVATAGGVGSCPQATNYLARVSVDTAHQNNYDSLICGLVADGVWQKLDTLYVFATENSTAALANLINSNFTATAQGAPTFSANSGYAVSAGKYISSNFNFSTNGTNYTQDAASIGGWSGSVGASYYPAWDTSTAYGGNTNILPLDPGGPTAFFSINGTTRLSAANSTASGMFALVRPDSSTSILYRNGSSLGSASRSSVALENGVFETGGNPTANNNYAGTIRAMFTGGGLTAGDVANFYARMNTYMGAVGATP